MHNMHVIRNVALMSFERKIGSLEHAFLKFFSRRLQIKHFNLLAFPKSNLKTTKQRSYDMNKNTTSKIK